MPAPIRDHLPLIARDVVAGFGLLTRLPVPFTMPRPEGAWAWPLVGLAVGFLAGLVGLLALIGGIAPPLAAVLVLALQVVLTGGLHEDGLADCADGFFGGQDKARRLEIMKDHQIGSYGALALVLAMLARWSALVLLIPGVHWGLFLAATMMSRLPMAAIMASQPNARGSGLSASVGAPTQGAVMAGLALTIGLSVALGGLVGLFMLCAVACVGYGMEQLAKARIGGQTGDVLGATQVLCEVAALTVAASYL